jgi:O-antigen/teichoic acid export membrane protein
MIDNNLKTRYAAKLCANLVGLLVGIVTQAIIPRGLGPKAYGDFSFLSNFFMQFVGFFDAGTSEGFYTKLSQRQKEIGIITFAIISSVALFLFVFIVGFTPGADKIWPGQLMFFVYLAAIWGIFSWFINILNKMVDAFGLTVPAELVRIAQKMLGVIIISTLFFFDRLNLRNFFFITMCCSWYLGFHFVGLSKSMLLQFGYSGRFQRSRFMLMQRSFLNTAIRYLFQHLLVFPRAYLTAGSYRFSVEAYSRDFMGFPIKSEQFASFLQVL